MEPLSDFRAQKDALQGFLARYQQHSGADLAPPCPLGLAYTAKAQQKDTEQRDSLPSSRILESYANSHVLTITDTDTQAMVGAISISPRTAPNKHGAHLSGETVHLQCFDAAGQRRDVDVENAAEMFMEIDGFCLLPSVQGQGLGTEILRQVIEAQTVTTHASPDLESPNFEGLVRFYSRCSNLCVTHGQDFDSFVYPRSLPGLEDAHCGGHARSGWVPSVTRSGSEQIPRIAFTWHESTNTGSTSNAERIELRWSGEIGRPMRSHLSDMP